MTDDEIVEIYLNHIAKWYGLKPTAQLAEDLDLTCEQVEDLVDHIAFPAFSHFAGARNVRKAVYTDRYPVPPSDSNVLPFVRK